MASQLRRPLDELKQIAIELAATLGCTPSRTQLNSVMKGSEYAYYGFNVREFQEYCGLVPNKSTIEQKISDNDLLQCLFELCVRNERILHQQRLRKAVRDGEFPIHTLEIRFGGMLGVQQRLWQYAMENNILDAIRELPGWKFPPKAHSTRKGTAFLFDELCQCLQQWSPALRRNNEEAYKAELSRFLKDAGRPCVRKALVREERGDSLCDITIDGSIGIETKKAPSIGDYDRCFGQIARHLRVLKFVVVLIFDVPRQEQFEDFCLLVDKHFGESVCVIKNG